MIIRLIHQLVTMRKISLLFYLENSLFYINLQLNNVTENLQFKMINFLTKKGYLCNFISVDVRASI